MAEFPGTHHRNRPAQGLEPKGHQIHPASPRSGGLDRARWGRARGVGPSPAICWPSAGPASQRLRVGAFTPASTEVGDGNASESSSESESASSKKRSVSRVLETPVAEVVPPATSSRAAPLPTVGCQRCIKWEFARGEACPCVRAVANQKCQRCQRLKKSCKAVPTQLRRRVAAALAVPINERDANELKLLSREMKSTSDHVPQTDMQQAVHAIRSLNPNMFRMLAAVNTLAGLPVPDDEEEMWMDRALTLNA